MRRDEKNPEEGASTSSSTLTETPSTTLSTSNSIVTTFDSTRTIFDSASTTVALPVEVPPKVFGYGVRSFSDPRVPIPIPTDVLVANSTAKNVTLSTGFALYLPYSATEVATVAVPLLNSALDKAYSGNDAKNKLPMLSPGEGVLVPVASTSSITFGKGGGTIFIPITKVLDTVIDMNVGLKALRDATKSTTASVSSDSAASSTTPNNHNHTQTDAGKGSYTTKSSSAEDVTPFSTGALAGGMVGAFLASGLICGFIAFFCLRRRRSRHVASEKHSSGPINDYALANLARDHEKSQVVVATSSVTGWQKHLPQEKDDGSIAKLFRSIFEQVQLHMEEYYGADPQAPSDTTVETLRKLAEDDLPLMLSQTGKQVLLLEGILLRCIIHRTSGRSDIKDSFLPSELIRIAKSNGWYMERTPRNSGIISSGRKRGFPQALAQWRQLTGFLLPEHRDDQAYQSELRIKIEHAVTEIDAAFLTWACAGKSSDKRMESLRQILLQSSDAGVLLFTQPSTFIFDWSVRGETDDRAATISPALVRFTEEAAKEDVLIEASQVKL